MTRLPIAALAIGAAAIIAGCGSTASGSTTSGSTGSTSSYGAPAATATAAAPAAAASSSAHVTTLRLKADPNGALRFNTNHLTAKAGTVKIVLTNPSSSGMEHAIAIQGHGSGKVVSAGGTSTLTATLKRGTYTFLCPVPGHAAGGMKGTLTVR
jgi:uncharacterized cupredoxin-like copper-binding protein